MKLIKRPKQHVPNMTINFPNTGSIITGETSHNVGRGNSAKVIKPKRKKKK